MKDPAAIDIPWGSLPRQFEAAGTMRDEFGAWRMVAAECLGCHGQLVASVGHVDRLKCSCGSGVKRVTENELKAAAVVNRSRKR